MNNSLSQVNEKMFFLASESGKRHLLLLLQSLFFFLIFIVVVRVNVRIVGLHIHVIDVVIVIVVAIVVHAAIEDDGISARELVTDLFKLGAKAFQFRSQKLPRTVHYGSENPDSGT